MWTPSARADGSEDIHPGKRATPDEIEAKIEDDRAGAMPTNLAEALHRWSVANPEPFLGAHYL